MKKMIFVIVSLAAIAELQLLQFVCQRIDFRKEKNVKEKDTFNYGFVSCLYAGRMFRTGMGCNKRRRQKATAALIGSEEYFDYMVELGANSHGSLPICLLAKVQLQI